MNKPTGYKIDIATAMRAWKFSLDAFKQSWGVAERTDPLKYPKTMTQKEWDDAFRSFMKWG